MITKEQLAQLIDHTLLKPDTTRDSVVQLCEEAKKYKFCSVCVNPSYVSLASSLLSGTDIKVCSVIGFPLGASTPEVKALEAERAISNGASEVDMVVNIGALKSNDYELIKREISEVVERVRTCQKDIIVKVIIETGLLTKDEKELACKLIKDAGANFVKTSTGFNASGATVSDIKLLKKVIKKLGLNIKVKASGGIRTFREAIKLIKVGADRIGTSSGVAIMEQFSNESHIKDLNLEKKNTNYVYFLCLIDWANVLKSEELNEIKDHIKGLGKSLEPIGDWIKVDLGWEKKINTISKSELGFYHSRLIFKFRLQKHPESITEIRKIREELEEEIRYFCEEKGIIKKIKEIKDKTAKPPYIFTYPIFELNRKGKFWKIPEQRPYSFQTTCFYTELYDKEDKKYVNMRISGGQIIATDMSKWFFETLVNIIYHEGLYRQTRDEELKEQHENDLIYRNLENRLEDFASRLMEIFHQYSSEYRSRKIQRNALYTSIIISIVGILLGILYFIIPLFLK